MLRQCIDRPDRVVTLRRDTHRRILERNRGIISISTREVKMIRNSSRGDLRSSRRFAPPISMNMVRERDRSCYDPRSRRTRLRAAVYIDARYLTLLGTGRPADARPPRSLEQRAVETFRETFGARPTVVARAPGRVELLGNHTDYNGGLSWPSTIDRFTVVAGRPVPGRSARFRSVNFDQEERFDLDAIEPGERGLVGPIRPGGRLGLAGGAWVVHAAGSRRRSRATFPSARGSPARRACRRRWRMFLIGGVPDRPRTTSTTTPGWPWPGSSSARRTPSSASRRACSISSRSSSARPGTP